MSNAFEEGFDEGLETAAKYLEATAQDYYQMATQAERGIGRLAGSAFAARKAQVDGYRDKGDLLRGQANHIREKK